MPKADPTARARAFLRESVRIITAVLGEERVGNARRNAWAGVIEDRDRAATREELTRMLAASRRS